MRERFQNLLVLVRKRYPAYASYVKRRRYTLAGLFLSVLCLALLVVSLRAIFSIGDANVTVGMSLPEETLSVQRGHISFHKQGRSAELTIQLSLKPTGGSEEDNTWVLRVPKSLKLRESIFLGGFQLKEHWVRDGARHYAYSGSPKRETSVFLKFQGKVFPAAREVAFSLFVYAPLYNQPPLRVTISGLDHSDIRNLTPSPSLQSSYAIDYDPLSWGPDVSSLPETVRFSIFDREQGYRTEFRIFTTGIFLGVFSSFLASILWDLIRELEKK